MHRRFRPLLLTSTALLTASVSALGVASPTQGQTLNSYGMPGAIDTPTAVAPPEGELSATVSYSDYATRTTISFQPVPRLTGALRYSKIDGLDPNRDTLSDRSFDVQFQLLNETQGWQPSVAIGLRDFMGTGVYSGEYLVATKTVTPRLRVSGGLGWGRLAGQWRRTDYNDEGGDFNVGDWFSGDVKPFASVEWQASDSLSVLAEYSYDDYDPEVDDPSKERPDGKFNLGVNYRIGDTYQIGAYTIGGNVFGIKGSVALNARKSAYPSGLEPAPAPVRPRPAPNADPDGWSGAWSADPTAQPAIQTALGDALSGEGQVLESMALSANRAEVRIRNNRYSQQAEAIGRTARLMTRALPPSVETFVITSMEKGVPTSSVVLRRSDIERLENTASAHIAQQAQIIDADPRVAGLVYSPGIYPKFTWNLRPYASLGLWDPDEPWRYEAGLQASATYEIRPGLILSGTVRQRAFGSLDQKGPGDLTPDEYEALGTDIDPDTGIPRVRSDSRMYTGNTSPTVPELTLAWYAKPTETTYTRVTAGLLERAFGGVSAEVLWKPVNSRLALGAEINRVRKRDFRDAFSFRDYEVTSGHLSAYYDFGNGIWGQVDVGKYLAGDKGATLALNREFENGWRVGAWATKTDMSAEDFGEGSFDKGVSISIPVTWAIGTPTKRRVGGQIRSIARDGGVRLRVKDRLYETVRESHTSNLYDGWGKFWR
ncbi:YjbH domain-containing protein [Paracoccus aurantiacus]|uniref:YjbH domain-containing protein n=1 Tax=Paracoccus aurantiacus TaxID=2599412 RepID=A0A5C6S1N7_9RHOB|nr:YjbH domain-containing protein [Paracoccus aurantiacus]TXB68499.1 YjbH domain-containing protein [Paracoccus aurantiacus]